LKTVELKTDIIRAIIASHQSYNRSLRDLAHNGRLSPAIMSLVHNGKKTRVKEVTALKIAEALGVEPETIIDFGGGHLSTQRSNPCCDIPSSRSDTPYPQRPPAPATPVPEEG